MTFLVHRFNQIPRWVIALVVSLAPIVATLFLVRFYLNANLLNFAPVHWNDQTWYWHQTLSFSKVGFASGYYVINEAVAPLAFFRFSSAGPLFPVIFGALGHLIGWGWLTGITFNMLMLAAATLIFIYLAQLDKLQMILTGFVLLVCGPVLLYIPTNSQESFHQAGAIIMAGVFYRLWQGKTSSRLWWSGLIFLLVMSLIRFSFVILLPPYFLISNHKPSLRRVIIAFVVGGVLASGVYMLVSLISSPGHNAIIGHLNSFGTSPLAALQDLYKVLIENLNDSFIGASAIDILTVDHVQGIQIAIIVISALVVMFPARNLRSQLSTKPLEASFHIYNLGVIALLSIFLYLADGFYRVFGIHVLLSILLLIAFRRLATVNILIIVSLLTFGTFTVRYKELIEPNVTEDRQALENDRQKWSTWISYQPDSDAWCNTILFPISLLDSHVLLVPAGMGITFYSDLKPSVQQPIHSKYLFLDQMALDGLNRYQEAVHIEPIATTNGGTIYHNLDADCPPPKPP